MGNDLLFICLSAYICLYLLICFYLLLSAYLLLEKGYVLIYVCVYVRIYAYIYMNMYVACFCCLSKPLGTSIWSLFPLQQNRWEALLDSL